MNAIHSPTKSLIAAAIAAILVSACASVPTEPAGAADLRARLTALQADPQLGNRAPVAMEQANAAVAAAERPQADLAEVAHLEFIADRKIRIATAAAQSQLAVDQRKGITDQRAAMQLRERTHEADVARDATADAQRNTVDAQRQAADAQRQADASQRQADELQQQITDLQAKQTDRGLVLTLGDVLFATGTANLNTGGSANLGKLAGFLTKYPTRTVQIEGYTDSVGGDEYNLGLSQRRADSVRTYLVNQGISPDRLTASGKGKSSPVGDNSSATGRQQNRRVEVIIANSVVSAL